MGIVELGIASLVLSAASGYANYRQGKKAAASNEEAQKVSRASQEQGAVRQRRQSARQARVARAQMIQAGVNTGTSGSSGESGAISSIATKVGGASAQLSNAQLTTSAVSSHLQTAADAQFKGQVQSSLLGLASQGVGMYGNVKQYQQTQKNLQNT